MGRLKQPNAVSGRSPLGIGLALAVIFGAFGVLGLYHWQDLTADPVDALSEDEVAYRACLEERALGIETLIEEGAITQQQKEMFLSRADALCRSSESTGPSLPAQ